TLGSGHQPFVGDFDGDGRDDLFAYHPSATGDTVWWGGPTRSDFSSTPAGLAPQTSLDATNTYDAGGLRTNKTIGTATTEYTWDAGATGLPLLLAEETAAGTPYLIYGPGGQPLEQIAPDGSATWLHRDHLGSIRLTTSAATGDEVSRRRFSVDGL